MAYGAPFSAVPKAPRAGRKTYGATHKTKDIEADLESSSDSVDDPQALAAWIRRRSLGEAEFREHQKPAKKK